MSDRVALRGIAGFGHHGVFAEERTSGQRFLVDVALTLDLGPAATTDDLSQTVDYGTLAASIVSDIQRDPVNLIEALALRIADRCLADQRVREAEVTVHKPEAPMPVEVGDVAVTLTRSHGGE